jgi:hypothetical protein
VERPDADAQGRRAGEGERLEGRGQPLAQLVGGPGVERDRCDLVGGCGTGRDQPTDASDERRRLARPGRRDTEQRPGRRGRGIPLVGREPGEAGHDVGMQIHRGTMAGADHLRINAVQVEELVRSGTTPAWAGRTVRKGSLTIRRRSRYRDDESSSGAVQGG